MFGISLPEFIIIIIFLLAITKPNDIPVIAKYLANFFYKVKYTIANIKNEISDISKNLGFEQIQIEAEQQILKEIKDIKKTTIIDIYGNKHEVHDVAKIRSDLEKEEIEEEVKRLNIKNNKKPQAKRKKTLKTPLTNSNTK
jgi:Sec-independent protein translocase protein TatA